MADKGEILLTGGLGFIGSHTWAALVEAGYRPFIVDNLANSSLEVQGALEKIGACPAPLEVLDCLDLEGLDRVFAAHRFQAVIHLAGLKAVGDSLTRPLDYYRINLLSAMNVMDCMARHRVPCLVFSSSATVYGEPRYLPLDEDHPTAPLNPYGRTKVQVEQMLPDWVRANPGCRGIVLRYFNPAGAHPSGEIGEEPRGIPNNLMPYIGRVARGELPRLGVYGTDYPTPDGTGVRDYIHVCDLARAHVAVLDLPDPAAVETFNVGTGQGYSVLQLLGAYSRACGRSLPWEALPRRPGDVAACWASSQKLKERCGWEARLDLDRICQDGWNFLKP